MSMYEIHLYVPKRPKLTEKMIEWLYEHGQDPSQPEAFYPVRKVDAYALARHMLRLDPALIAVQSSSQGDVELHYPDPQMGIVLYAHDRGIILFFPLMAYNIYSRVVLGICYTYMRFLYQVGGFWCYDPQLNAVYTADGYEWLERAAVMMNKIVSRRLKS